jgi:hypothetical protein
MRLSKSRRERTWMPAFFIFSFFMRERERERERLVRLFGRVRRQRGFSSSLVLSRSRHPRKAGRREKKRKIRQRAKAPARNHPTRERARPGIAPNSVETNVRETKLFVKRSVFFLFLAFSRISLSVRTQMYAHAKKKSPLFRFSLSSTREKILGSARRENTRIGNKNK